MELDKKRILPAFLALAFGIAVSLEGFRAGEVSFPKDAAASLEAPAGLPAGMAGAVGKSGNRRIIDFGLLKAWNRDIYAWITVPGTGIDYPVLQKGDSGDPYDNYYLNHTPDLEEGLPGAVYSQPANHKDFMDPVTVLYGHNMKDGGMFTGLHGFEDKGFFGENRGVVIYTPDGTYLYEIFAAVEFSDALIPYEYDFSHPSEVQRYLDDIGKCEGNFMEGMDVSERDKILTLSTCYSGREDSRLLVVAALAEVFPMQGMDAGQHGLCPSGGK